MPSVAAETDPQVLAAQAELAAARETAVRALAQRTAEIRRLGRQPYAPVWAAMQHYTDHRDSNSSDQLWLLEHEAVFTQGLAGKAEHVLDPGTIPVVQVDRGGQVTYHGPGQLIVYPLLDLRRLGLGVRDLVHGLEQAVIDTLAAWVIRGERRDGAPGVYVEGRKLMALGLRVRRGCSFHGLALNVAMDLAPYQRINPCGYQGLQVTQISELGGPADLDVVAAELLPRLGRQLRLSL